CRCPSWFLLVDFGTRGHCGAIVTDGISIPDFGGLSKLGKVQRRVAFFPPGPPLSRPVPTERGAIRGGSSISTGARPRSAARVPRSRLSHAIARPQGSP